MRSSLIALFATPLFAVSASADNYICNQLCPIEGSDPVCSEGLLEHQCWSGHKVCEGTCVNGHSKKATPDYRPTFCAGSPPNPDNIIKGNSVNVPPYNVSYSCVTVPPGKVATKIYCNAVQDPGYSPSQGWCSIDEGNGESCGIGWSWITFTVGNRLPDGSNRFCVHFYNHSGDRTRYFAISAE
ncbi:hypothetical protein ACVITL_001812 [Rhizobium pisi]